MGDKLMEVSVFSPSGLGRAQALYDVDFADAVIEALERKVAHRDGAGAGLSNPQLATW